MATPTAPKKSAMNCGMRQGSAWGTAVALGAGYGLVVPNDGKPALKQTYGSTDAIGQLMPLDGDLSAYEPVEFEIPFDSKCGLQYSPGELGTGIAVLFGASAAPAAVNATAVYAHVLTWADEETDFVTFATERPGAIWEVPSASVKKLTLKIGDGKVQGSLALVGNLLKNDSSINGATQMDALTPETTANFVKFQHGVLRMNDQADGALAAPTDVIDVSDFTIEYERLLVPAMILGGSYVAQPKESGFKISVKLTLPYATAANVAYLDLFKNMSPQKMDITFTGGVAATTEAYKLILEFPRLKLVAPPDVALEDIIKNQLEFVAEEAATAPTGMTVVRPSLTLHNLRTSNYLS